MKHGRINKLLFFPTLALAIGLSLAFSPAARAQGQEGRGSISGIVRDPSGAVVIDTEVSLVNAQQAVLRDTKTDTEGRFRFTDVPVGSYAITISRSDFGRRREAVQVTAGSTAELSVVLQPSQVSEQVTVTAEAGQVSDARNTAQPVNIIREEDIIERAPEVVAQVVDEEQGVNLQRTSPSLSAVFVRGLTGRNVAVYVDGVRYTTSAQRGGVGTFFSLIEPSSLETVEILRGPNSSQYGSDVLGGVVNFISRAPIYGGDEEWHGNTSVFYTSPTNGFGGNTLLTYGTERYGLLFNLNARRINRLRPGRGLDTHAAVTRFLGIPSDVLGERLPDTAFTQYGGLLRTSFNLDDTTQLLLSYSRNQQDGGRRYDQLAGGDGNLIADLRNLMTDLFYARVVKQKLGFFDNGQFTFSYNGQREERVNQGGQGNPLAAITNQRERTNVLGFNFHLDKRISENNTLTFGADVYRDKISAPAFTTDPTTRVATPSRPRIPNGARYLSYGFFVQDVLTAIPDRLRLSGALRYSVASYKSRAENAPVVGGVPLFPNDSARFDSLSGRIGAVLNVGGGFDIAAKYTRGFRAPNTTDLGIIGLVGTGFEVDAATAATLGGFIGTSAGADAVSSGIPVERLGAEKSDSFDLSFRYTRPRFRAELTGFTNKLTDVYFDQALVLPPGAVGRFLGSEQIVRQNANGLVFVAAATSPVLVRVNYEDARFNGVEFDTEARLSRDFTARGNFTHIRAYSLLNGLPPNIEGGLPPATGFLSLRYQPNNSTRFYVEAYSTLAARQNRLSSLDLSDRRTGAARSRAQIQNFFRRGACVRGVTSPGATGCGSAGGILISTGETLAQVQNRLLPIGATINGVTVVNNDTSVPLFIAVPGYGLVGLRAAFRFDENSEVFFDFENIADKQYRGISWGVDGAGRGVTLRYRYKF
ncbi:MAG TPA: TonB-dependent receptor [Pyrinomonadaceae bacterium]|jgi:outer membrane receptor protein involved in Fe transport|nr:TonB-dependent receptor [Pyrinomonadaceae bacterium]